MTYRWRGVDDGPDFWLEYDCPDCFIDFDVRPLPAFGAAVYCSGCGKDHRLGTEVSVNVYRDGDLITEAWERGEIPTPPSESPPDPPLA